MDHSTPTGLAGEPKAAQYWGQALPEHVNPIWEGNGFPVASRFMAPGRPRYEVLCILRPSSAQPQECPLGNLNDASYFWILYFILAPIANVSEMSWCLRTRNLICSLKEFRQKQVSPYQFTRSAFKANIGPYFIKWLMKNLFFTSSLQATTRKYTIGMPGEGQTPSHTRTARALGWLTLTPQLTSQTVM